MTFDWVQSNWKGSYGLSQLNLETCTTYETSYTVQNQGRDILSLKVEVVEIVDDGKKNISASYIDVHSMDEYISLGENLASVDEAKKLCEDWIHSALLTIKSALSEIN